MDKYQTTVAVKKAALTFGLACFAFYAHRIAKLVSPDLAGPLWLIGAGMLAATPAFPLMYVLQHGIPTYHLD